MLSYLFNFLFFYKSLNYCKTVEKVSIISWDHSPRYIIYVPAKFRLDRSTHSEDIDLRILRPRKLVPRPNLEKKGIPLRIFRPIGQLSVRIIPLHNFYCLRYADHTFDVQSVINTTILF